MQGIKRGRQGFGGPVCTSVQYAESHVYLRISVRYGNFPVEVKFEYA